MARILGEEVVFSIRRTPQWIHALCYAIFGTEVAVVTSAVIFNSAGLGNKHLTAWQNALYVLPVMLLFVAPLIFLKRAWFELRAKAISVTDDLVIVRNRRAAKTVVARN